MPTPLGFVLLPLAHAPTPPASSPSQQHVTFHRTRDEEGGGGWRTWLSVAAAAAAADRGQHHGAEDENQQELQLRDSAAVELLQAVGRVAHDNKMRVTAQLLFHPTAAAPKAQEQHFVKLLLALPVSVIQHSQWKRSPASTAAALFKQLFPCDTPLGDAVQQVLMPRLRHEQQQKQQQQQHSDSSNSPAAASRFTLVSCFRELPSVNTAPPPTTISIRQQQQQEQLEQLEQQEQPTPAAAGAGSSSDDVCPTTTTSLADVPAEVMGQLLSLLTARDLAALALTCNGLRAATWEAVPGLRLVLYPHQRNALSWMLHRESRGGGLMPHPFVREFVTGGGEQQQEQQQAEESDDGGAVAGVPLYLNQVTGELSLDPPAPLHDIRGGFFCDEPGLGKTVTALSLILKTQGTLPTPPRGAAVTWLHGPDGRRQGFYTCADTPPAADDSGTAEATAAADASGGAGGLLRRRSSGSLRRSSSSFGSLPVVGGGRRSSSAFGRQSSAWQLAPSLRGGSSTRRAKSASAAPAPAPAPAAAAAGGGAEDSAAAAGAGEPASVGAVAAEAVTVQQQQQQPRRVTRQGSSSSGAAAAAQVGTANAQAGAAAAAVAAAFGGASPPEQSAAKRQKLANGSAALQPPPQPEQHAAVSAGAVAASGEQQPEQPEQQEQQQQQQPSPVVSPPPPQQRGWVMCDHCSKWRSLPPGYRLPDADPDLPWFCCLHPEPHMVSCLAPEEPHDGNTGGAAAADTCVAGLGYSACAGFVPADHAAAAAAGAKLHDDNVAHFAAVVHSASVSAHADDSRNVLCWLAKQSPDALHEGVTVPRELVKWAPEYGRLFTMMSLQLASKAAAATRKTAAAAAAKPPRSASSKAKQPPGSSSKAASSNNSKKKKPAAPQRRKKRRRVTAGSSSDEDTDSDWEAEAEEEDSDSDEPDGRPSSSSGGRKGQQTSRPAAAKSSSTGAGSKQVKARRLSAATAAHTWCQPPSLSSLTFDVQALRTALSEGAAVSPRIFLSSATLVIVPVTLIPHWKQQIRQHLMPRRLRVLVLGSATAVAGGQDAPSGAAAGGRGRGGGSSSKAHKASSTAAGGGGAAESVCPPAHELAWGYDVVITTFQRLSSDWSMRSDPRLAERLVLLRVHFLRIIVDEGHSLGASLGLTNKLAMAIQLRAQRRWVMTGTPTPSTSSGSGAAHLHPLLSFLHQEPFGTSKAAWDGAVVRPLEAAADASSSASASGAATAAAGDTPAAVVLAEWGRQQLMQLMSRAMIRSCKSDLALLPPCYKKVTLLDFAPAHAKSYNALVEVIRRNLLLADWCDDAHSESLLNVKQSRWAKEMLSNVRKACCVAGGMNLVIKEEDLLECLQLLSGRLDYPPPSGHVAIANTQPQQQQQQQEQQQQPEEPQAGSAAPESAAAAAAAPGSLDAGAAPAPSAAAGAAEQAADAGAAAGSSAAAAGGSSLASGVVLRRRWYFTGPDHPLHAVEEALREGCDCQVCGAWSPFPLVTPCGHLQCTDCTSLGRALCRVCSKPFRMQAVDDPERFKTNAQPKWTVPLELIEWQPVYHQAGATGLSGGEWSANWAVTRSTKVLQLVQRLIEIGVYQPPRAPQQQQQERSAAAAGGGAEVADAGSSHLVLRGCLKGGGAGAGSNLNAAAIALQQPLRGGQAGAGGAGAGAIKVIVFSQFWMHVQLIAAELSARGIQHYLLNKALPARDKQAAVMAFRASPHNCCLLMDESGALGLDLSFVRYVFLLEPLADASLEQQVVSRAHRMGAVAPVHVEVMAMRHTAEEHMVALRHQTASGKLSASAADAAASSAAAAVAGSDGAPPNSPAAGGSAAQQPQPQQGHHQSPAAGGGPAAGGDVGEELLGGATATAKAVDMSNISDFVAAGAGDNQLNSRAMRNLLLLHLKKVNVAELPELPEYDEGAAASLQGVDSGAAAHLQSLASASRAAAGVVGSSPGLWSDVALVQSQRQHHVAQAAGGSSQQPQPPPQQQVGAGEEVAAASKPARKRIRFADDEDDA